MVRKRCVNPFFHRIVLKPSDLITVIPGSLILAPIRIILILLLFIIASFLSKLCIIYLSFIDKENDTDHYHLWRERFKNIIIHLFRAILFVCGFYKINIIQKGDVAKEKDAPIYVFAPHTSLFDILAGVALGAPSSVAKADIINIPLFGNIFKLSDPVLVERDSKDSRQDVFKKVADVIKYSKIVFFPEGTCSNHRGLLQFKTGAFKFGYPIIPVALRFNQFGGPDTLSWTWDGPNTFWSVWLTLCRWKTDLELTKLSVYYPTEEEKTDPELYAASICKILVKELRLPCLFYTYDDARYFKYNFFRSSTCVKFMKLADKIRQTRGPLSSPNTIQADTNTSNTKTQSRTSNSSANITSNGIDSKKEAKKARETLYTNFLYDFIDEINENLIKVNLNDKLDQETLIELLNIGSVPGINSSYSVKELMLCFERTTNEAKIIHLKTVLELIDLREENLWERLRSAFEAYKEYDHAAPMLSFEDLKDLLWISLSLEDVDLDDEIKDIKIMSFDDLRNMLINHYNFALKENACSIYKKEFGGED